MDRCSTFLTQYGVTPVKGGPIQNVYMTKLLQVARRECVKVEINLGDVLTWSADGDSESGSGAEFVRDITANAKRYQELFSQAIDALLPPPASDAHNAVATSVTSDVQDVLMLHRVAAFKNEMRKTNPGEDVESLDTRKMFPPALYRRYEVRFVPTASTVPLSLRGVRASMLGQLVTIKCIVIRASDIKPLATLLTYTWCVRARACAGSVRRARGPRAVLAGTGGPPPARAPPVR